ncbi:hypothetical protein [Tenacibaculum aestuariivivum]
MPTNKFKPEIKFELYSEDNIQLTGELVLVDKWSKQLNEHIKNK